MRFVLLVAALVAEAIAAASAFGLVVHVGARHELGCVALGFVLYLLALQPLPGPPAPRRPS